MHQSQPTSSRHYCASEAFIFQYRLVDLPPINIRLLVRVYGKRMGFLVPLFFHIVAFICTIAAIALAVLHIYRHLLNYTEPTYQRYIVRIIFMVPVYALMSFLSLVIPDSSIYFNSIREVYEAWVIYNFLSLCLAWVGGPGAVVISLSGRVLKPSFCLMTCCFPPIPLDGRFIRKCKQGCLQFVILKPILVVVTLILYAKGKYKDGNFNPKQSYLYLTIIYMISYTMALYVLALFYVACKDLLQPFNPVPKFIIIKSVVFLTYWQLYLVTGCMGVLFFLAAKSGFIEDADEAALLQNFIICVEMLVAAVGHFYAFPYKEYAGANIGGSRGLTASLGHALKLNDFYHDTVHQFAPTYHEYVLYNHSEGEEGTKKYRSRTFVPIGPEMDSVRRNKHMFGNKLDDIQLSSLSYSTSSTPSNSGSMPDASNSDATNSSLLVDMSNSVSEPYDLTLIDLDVSSYPEEVPAADKAGGRTSSVFFVLTKPEREMEEGSCVCLVVILILALTLAWRVLNWLWLRPKRLERLLREQGLQGNPYRLLVGDLKEIMNMQKEVTSKPMNLSHDIVPRVFSFLQHTLNTHGKNSFIWFGRKPRVIITEPELIKDVLNKMHDFPKPDTSPLVKLLATGLLNHEGEKWNKHRRIISPAFNLEKLKNMLPIFYKSCNDLIIKWEEMLSSDGSCEIDVWPFLQNLSSDAIARTAFGSSYEEGRKIFQLLKEQAELAMKAIMKLYIPGWRFLPTANHRRMKEIDREIKASLTDMISNREKALKAGEATENDLLGILLETNHKETEEHGNSKNVGMSLEDVIEECKLFYFAGQETTSALLVWTMVLLSRYPDWQARAREEVLQVFGKQKPNFDGLSHLKIVSMILNEVLRLYPPAVGLNRNVDRDMKLGNLSLPAGVQVSLPTTMVHHDRELWGDDVNEFKPERFSEGVLKATNGRVSFFPFGWGPRICIGQNFSLLEAKMALSTILQHFSFELSPAYAHAPVTVFTLQPQYGAHVILRKVEI
ncbi:Cytochrome P450 72A68 [Glycine soja]